MKIPRTIHQIWGDNKNPEPPQIFLEMTETWKTHHPEWNFLLWKHNDINEFLREYYPDFIDTFLSYKYNIQRWDMLRYLILCHSGGVYIDHDCECLESIDGLLGDNLCCIGLEPDRHRDLMGLDLYVGNAFMATIPNHHFFNQLIKQLPLIKSDSRDKLNFVLETTGPLMLTRFYQNYTPKEEVFLIPSKYIAPLDLYETRTLFNNKKNKMVEQKIQEAYCIHYFFGSWTK